MCVCQKADSWTLACSREVRTGKALKRTKGVSQVEIPRYGGRINLRRNAPHNPRYLGMAKLASAIPIHGPTPKPIAYYERKLLQKLEHEAALNKSYHDAIPTPT